MSQSSNPETDTEAGRITTIEKLAAKVEQIWDKVMSSGDTGGHVQSHPEVHQDDAGVSGEMRRALQQLRDEERAQQDADAAADARMDEKIKAAVPERQPREYRKSTNFMRWATDDDR